MKTRRKTLHGVVGSVDLLSIFMQHVQGHVIKRITPYTTIPLVCKLWNEEWKRLVAQRTPSQYHHSLYLSMVEREDRVRELCFFETVFNDSMRPLCQQILDINSLSLSILLVVKIASQLHLPCNCDGTIPAHLWAPILRVRYFLAKRIIQHISNPNNLQQIPFLPLWYRTFPKCGIDPLLQAITL